jgi:hypothetical protein
MATAEQQLKTFVARFSPEHQRVIRAARRILRRRFPGACELVYDNYNFFVIGYGPNERPSEAWFTIAAAATGVGLCLVHGARLPDPEGLLQGLGQADALPAPGTGGNPGTALGHRVDGRGARASGRHAAGACARQPGHPLHLGEAAAAPQGCRREAGRESDG